MIKEIQSNCDELREIAEWLDKQGKKGNGDFLRSAAHKLEILFAAYNTKQQIIDRYVSAVIRYRDAADPAVLIPLTDEIADKAEAEWENLLLHRSAKVGEAA